MATRTWSSASSTDMNNSSNYSGSGALLTTDNLVFDNTSVINATASANLDVASVTISVSYTGTWSINGRTLICETGNFIDDGTTGAHNYGNGITLNGASATFHAGSSINSLTSTSCVLTFNGTTGCVLDDDESIIIKTLVLGPNAILTLSGAGNFTVSNSASLLVFTDGGTLTINQACTLMLSGSTNFVSVLAGTPTVNGNSTLVLSVNAASLSVGLCSCSATFGGTLALRIDNGASGNNCTFSLNNNLTCNALEIRNLRNSTTYTFDANDYNISCTSFTWGATTGTSRTIVINAGNGSHSITSLLATLDGTSMSQTLNLEGSSWSCSGSWTLGVNHTLAAGTSRVTFTNTASVTSNGETWYNVDINATGKTITLVDTLTCNLFTIINGTVVGTYIETGTRSSETTINATVKIYKPFNPYLAQTGYYKKRYDRLRRNLGSYMGLTQGM